MKICLARAVQFVQPSRVMRWILLWALSGFLATACGNHGFECGGDCPGDFAGYDFSASAPDFSLPVVGVGQSCTNGVTICCGSRA
jgi:hypothetical protein